MSKSTVAIFDVDGVIVNGQSLFLFVWYLFKKRKVSSFYFISIFVWFLFYKIGLTKDVVSMRTKALKIIKGWRVSDTDQMVKDFYRNDLQKKLNQSVLKILRFHINRGHLVVLASASINPLIKIIAKDLGVENYVSSGVESNGDFYTGRSGEIAYGNEKLKLVRKLLFDSNIDLGDVYVYSDDLSDQPLLHFAKYARVINPNSQLRSIALKQRWQINDL